MKTGNKSEISEKQNRILNRIVNEKFKNGKKISLKKAVWKIIFLFLRKKILSAY